MDIRLIRNFESGQCMPIEEDLILQITDDNYQLNGFTGKKIFIADVVNNNKQEVMPGFRKYDLACITDVSGNKDAIYFTTALRQNETDIKVTLIKYLISNGESIEVYSFHENLNDLETKCCIKLYILDENYIFVQKERFQMAEQAEMGQDCEQGCADTLHGLAKIENFLYCVEELNQIPICDPVIANSGIDRIITLDGNICAVKLGYSVLRENANDSWTESQLPTELIGIVNIKQFISDLVLKKEQVFIETLDTGSENRTFPYMKVREGSLVYSRVDVLNHKEEVVIYDYETKITKVRVNNNLVQVSDLWHTYLINDTPYLLSEYEDHTDLINLNTQKTEYVFPSDVRVKFIKNDIIVVEKHVDKGLLKKESDYIMAYRYPDMEETILKEKARCVGCVTTPQENLLIFSN